jgi:hypothetical protein
MSRIGEYKPGVANLPVPNNEADRALLKRLLGNAGGLTAAQALPAHHEITHLPGLFPKNPYADEGPTTTGDNLFDSEGKSPPQPASVPVPIVHHTEAAPLSHKYGRNSPQAYLDKPVDEAEVAKVRALLNRKPFPDPPATTVETAYWGFLDKPVDETEVAKVRALLNCKPFPEPPATTVETANRGFVEKPVDEAEVAKVRVLLNRKPFPEPPATTAGTAYRGFVERPVDEAEVAKVRALLSGRSLAGTRVSEKPNPVTQLDLDQASEKLGEMGLTVCADWEGRIFYRLPKGYSVAQCQSALPAIERYTSCAKALNDELKHENGQGLLKQVKARIEQS